MAQRASAAQKLKVDKKPYTITPDRLLNAPHRHRKGPGESSRASEAMLETHAKALFGGEGAPI